MAKRRKAMMAKPASSAAMPPPMKKGGKAEGGESKATHKAEMSKMKGLEKELKSHESKPASKGHKGLKTGGVALGNAGGFKTGGVTMGNAGGYKTGGVTMGNAGGYKMGGQTSKKAYATGGTVNSGKPVAMPQGRKKPSSPVSINQLAGTFKKGGSVTPAEGRLQNAFAKENATGMKQAKAQSNEVYSKYQKMKGGGATSDKEMDMSKGAYDASKKHSMELEEAMNPLSMVKELYGKARDAFRGKAAPPAKGQGAVTETEKSITVSPAGKKRGGSAC
jgi:hypothetical protein